jgi:hypothetical protein
MGSSMRLVDNLWITRRDNAQNSGDNSMHLTPLLPSIAEGEPLERYRSLRRLVVRAGLCLFAALAFTNAQPAQANEADHYKLYAHSRLINWKQTHCFIAIINKESRWNVKAKNGSHFGLGQMRSEHYRDLDGYRQIDATIKYITIRYGSMCNAWRFHQRVGHY